MTATVRSDSLFCFALMMADGYEKGLIRMQLENGMSIFACEGWDVFSSEHVELTPGPPVRLFSKSIGSMKCEIGGPWHLALNTHVFVKAWKLIFEEERFLQYGWTVKVE